MESSYRVAMSPSRLMPSHVALLRAPTNSHEPRASWRRVGYEMRLAAEGLRRREGPSWDGGGSKGKPAPGAPFTCEQRLCRGTTHEAHTHCCFQDQRAFLQNHPQASQGAWNTPRHAIADKQGKQMRRGKPNCWL